ncbi:unnamed protein product [Ectocarpus sp. 12 AP-2014]
MELTVVSLFGDVLKLVFFAGESEYLHVLGNQALPRKRVGEKPDCCVCRPIYPGRHSLHCSISSMDSHATFFFGLAFYREGFSRSVSSSTVKMKLRCTRESVVFLHCLSIP